MTRSCRLFGSVKSAILSFSNFAEFCYWIQNLIKEGSWFCSKKVTKGKKSKFPRKIIYIFVHVNSGINHIHKNYFWGKKFKISLKSQLLKLLLPNCPVKYSRWIWKMGKNYVSLYSLESISDITIIFFEGMFFRQNVVILKIWVVKL